MTNKINISHWWNELISRFDKSSILQTYQWGEVKEQFGWKASLHIWEIDSAGFHEDSSKDCFTHHTIRFQATDQHVRFDSDRIAAASMVLMREASISGLPYAARILYAPRGPLLRSWENENLRRKVLEDLISFAKEEGAFFIKVDPEVVIGYGEPDPSLDINHPGNPVIREMQTAGWTYSPAQIQFKNTMLLALEKSEEDLLMDMKQKTRYNIRLSDRKGVSVRIGTSKDYDLLYEMYQETASRDGFVIRGREYYYQVWDTFALKKDDSSITTPVCLPLIAEFKEMPIAALVMFIFGNKAWYLYGMSTSLHRNKMPNYLLQWEAIKQAKQAGCEVYDLWGAPEVFDESDDMWGVYRFKAGLGSEIMRTIGAWDYPVRPVLYTIYTKLLPKLLSIMRSRRMREIEGSPESFV